MGALLCNPYLAAVRRWQVHRQSLACCLDLPRALKPGFWALPAARWESPWVLWIWLWAHSSVELRAL